MRKDILFYGKFYKIEILKVFIFLKMYKFRINLEILKIFIIVEGKLFVFYMLYDIVIL